MIDYVYGGEYMIVNSSKGATPYLNHNANPMQGAISYDSATQSLKVFDGNSWMKVGGGSAQVNLSPDAINILKWAEKKMQEEAELERLAETNPTIKDLMDQIKQKEEQLNIVLSLIKEEEKV
jgi:hypothetical protein